MEPPVRTDGEDLFGDEKVKGVEGDPAASKAEDLVRGQFRSYHAEPGVAPRLEDGNVHCHEAGKLIPWRWHGVPFYASACRKESSPITCTEVLVRLRQPPTMYQGYDLKSNYCRLRISPDISFGICMNTISPDDEKVSQPVEIAQHRYPRAEEMDAYERVLGDAMAGDPTLFAREDYVEEAWRIVDPVLKSGSTQSLNTT